MSQTRARRRAHKNRRKISQSASEEAEETLKTMLTTEGKWKVITGYYACYHALYAVLMRCGIRSEIHDCTLILMKMLGFNREEEDFLSKLKEDRIRAQYHLEDRTLKDAQAVKLFIERCKNILQHLSDEKITSIRQELRHEGCKNL